MAKGKYKYWLTEDGLLLLEGWARDGLTDEQIADKMDIGRSTLYEWKKKYSDISDALKKGKEIVDYQVENALFKKTQGFWAGDKYYPPDTTSIIFWLKNRCPDKWRDKTENIVENKSENEIKINILSTKDNK